MKTAEIEKQAEEYSNGQWGFDNKYQENFEISKKDFTEGYYSALRYADQFKPKWISVEDALPEDRR